MRISKVFEGGNLLEGPLFCERTGQLYFTDITGHCIHILRKDGVRDSLSLPSADFVPCLGLTSDPSKILCTTRNTLGVLDVETGERRVLGEIALDETMRFNDGKVAPDGSFYVGSMGIGDDRGPSGSLFRITGEGAEKVLDGMTIPNGMDWFDGFFYHTDTVTGTIIRYDDRFRFVDSFRFDGESPDGFTISRSGLLYVALWGSGRVAVVDWKRKSEVDSIKIDGLCVSCCVFAGSRLYVTVAAGEDGAGKLFEIETDDQMKEVYRWQI